MIFQQTTIRLVTIVSMGGGKSGQGGPPIIRPCDPLPPDPYLILGHHLADERQVLLDLFHVCRAQQGLRGSGDEREHLLL